MAQERAIRTRRTILDAAAAIFDERGYEAATISEVLGRAGVTKGALYHHFQSKEDLARGVLEGAVTTEGVRPQDLKLQEVVDILLLMACRLPREPMFSAALRIAVDLQSQVLIGTRWPDWCELLAGLLAEAHERGELIRCIDGEEAARILVAAWTGVRIVSEGLPGEYDLAYDVSLLLQLLMPSLAMPTVLARLEISAERAARLFAEMSSDSQDVQAEGGRSGAVPRTAPGGASGAVLVGPVDG
ncbi:ScbR family autoregulator-binding transcription factor [Streptomyces anulatus]|uniref:ScbR family autoregulator-binding transcription factor n=1 Tax=Streptomyces anulatus TaxID=1892 RepID=UPI0036316BE9